MHAQSSEPSSVPSTSDEEVERPRQLVGMSDTGGHRSDTGGDTSTMESAQMVDRAKSFEYIPGRVMKICIQCWCGVAISRNLDLVN